MRVDVRPWSLHNISQRWLSQLPVVVPLTLRVPWWLDRSAVALATSGDPRWYCVAIFMPRCTNHDPSHPLSPTAVTPNEAWDEESRLEAVQRQRASSTPMADRPRGKRPGAQRPCIQVVWDTSQATCRRAQPGSVLNQVRT